jgi:hypothetical protein
MGFRDPAEAILAWEQFFIVYFEALATGVDVVPSA